MQFLGALLCKISTALSLSVCLQSAPAQAYDLLPLQQIKMPPGFQIALFARVPNARAMSLGENTLFVGSMRLGSVYAVPLKKTAAGYSAGAVLPIANGLESPAGLSFYQGDLYVSSLGNILRYAAIERHLEQPPKPVVVVNDLPAKKWHGARYIRFSPDGWLYANVGAPCNVCEPEAGMGAILRMRPDGSERSIYARGVRNSVGFDWSPVDGALWFSDNGRDMLGDDMPPCELNRAERAGLHFGFPYCHGGSISDPEFGARHACTEFSPPAQNLGAHVAPLGLRFYRGTMFPAAYRNQLFIAEHGSWNRSRKAGYRISLVRVDKDRTLSYEAFATGWVHNELAWGRPADLQELPDGSLLVADDQAGAIYRISYRQP